MTMTLYGRMRRNGIRCGVTYRGRQRYEGWEHDRWTVIFVRGSERLLTVFRIGTGNGRRPPEGREVLSALLNEAREDPENTWTFERWREEFGCGLDDRRARRAYLSRRRMVRDLRRFLGDDLYSTYLWETIID